MNSGPSKTLVHGQFSLCESCNEVKMIRRRFTAKERRASKCLKLVNIDVCGLFNVHAHGIYEYFITFIDNYSRYGYVYQIVRKYKVDTSKKQFGKHVKVLRSDWGGESMSGEFDFFFS